MAIKLAAKPAITANKMLKLIIVVIIGLAIVAFGISRLSSDKTSGSQQQIDSAAQAIESAKDAVQQTQELQDKINSRASDAGY